MNSAMALFLVSGSPPMPASSPFTRTLYFPACQLRCGVNVKVGLLASSSNLTHCRISETDTAVSSPFFSTRTIVYEYVSAEVSSSVNAPTGYVTLACASSTSS